MAPRKNSKFQKIVPRSGAQICPPVKVFFTKIWVSRQPKLPNKLKSDLIILVKEKPMKAVRWGMKFGFPAPDTKRTGKLF